MLGSEAGASSLPFPALSPVLNPGFLLGLGWQNPVESQRHGSLCPHVSLPRRTSEEKMGIWRAAESWIPALLLLMLFAELVSHKKSLPENVEGIERPGADCGCQGGWWPLTLRRMASRSKATVLSTLYLRFPFPACLLPSRWPAP